MLKPLASPCAGAPELKYGDVSTVTTSPGEVKGLIILISHKNNEINIKLFGKVYINIYKLNHF